MRDKIEVVKIMLVEDSEADVDLLKFCLKKNKIKVELSIFDNGKDALSDINSASTSLPDLILLDINLPGMNGIEILENLKNNPVTKIIPVIMLTSSDRDEDIIQSYSNYANCFLKKPLNLESFQRIVDVFEDFWLTIVKLPKL